MGLGLFLKSTYLLVTYCMGYVFEVAFFCLFGPTSACADVDCTQQLGDGITPMTPAVGIVV